MLTIVFLWLQPWRPTTQPPTDTPTDAAPSEPASTPEASPDTSLTVPIDENHGNSGTLPPSGSVSSNRKSTATVVITSKTLPTPVIAPEEGQNSPPPPANVAPVLATVLPTTGTNLADALDGSTHYKSLIFSATAQDNEDGAITDPDMFHWSNVTANCSAAGADLCQNETDGNNFTMNMPVSGVCPGINSIDLSRDYKFTVTVQDSGGLTDVREIDISITYHCVADPVSMPLITLNSPTATQYPGGSYDAWNQPYSSVVFQAGATDNEDGNITNPTAFTWRLLSNECGEVIGGANIVCQTEKVDNNFTMDMLGACVNGSGDTGTPVAYTYELSVQDSDGNITTEQISFSVSGSCGNQGN